MFISLYYSCYLQTIDNNVNPKWDYWCEVRSNDTFSLSFFPSPSKQNRDINEHVIKLTKNPHCLHFDTFSQSSKFSMSYLLSLYPLPFYICQTKIVVAR